MLVIQMRAENVRNKALSLIAWERKDDVRLSRLHTIVEMTKYVDDDAMVSVDEELFKFLEF